MHDILIPVETTHRELDAKLLLGIRLLKPGRRVFIGSIRRLNRLASLVRNGVYIGDWGFSPQHRDHCYAPMKRNGFAFLSLIEEGGVWPGDEDDWNVPLAHHVSLNQLGRLGHDDWICAWGEFQAAYYRKHLPLLASRVRVTGHPRFDFYSSRYRSYFGMEVERIKKKYGRFVLFNTNLGLANNRNGIENTFSLAQTYNVNDPPARFRLLRMWEDNMKTLGEIVHLVHRLSAEFPELAFVLRPHPSENLSFYKAVFAGASNVHAVHEGSVGAWILAAEALVHDGSTTAIEAQLLGKSVLSLAFQSNRPLEIRIANEIGHHCKTPEAVIEALRPLAASRSLQPSALPAEAAVKRLIANFSVDALDALSGLVDESLSNHPNVTGVSSGRLRWHEWLETMRIFPQQFGRRLRERLRGRGSEHRKFYPFRKADLHARISRIELLLGRSVNWTRLSSEVVMLSAT